MKPPKIYCLELKKTNKQLLRELEADKTFLKERCENLIDDWVLAAETLQNTREQIRILKRKMK